MTGNYIGQTGECYLQVGVVHGEGVDIVFAFFDVGEGNRTLLRGSVDKGFKLSATKDFFGFVESSFRIEGFLEVVENPFAVDVYSELAVFENERQKLCAEVYSCGVAFVVFRDVELCSYTLHIVGGV